MKRVRRSLIAAIEKSAPAPSFVCMPPDEMKQMTGSRCSAQYTSSLQNFSALAMSKAPAWKSALEITVPTRRPPAPSWNVPTPVITPHGVVSRARAASMDRRSPGNSHGSELRRSGKSSSKSVKKASTNAADAVALRFLNPCRAFWMRRSR